MILIIFAVVKYMLGSCIGSDVKNAMRRKKMHFKESGRSLGSLDVGSHQSDNR